MTTTPDGALFDAPAPPPETAKPKRKRAPRKPRSDAAPTSARKPGRPSADAQLTEKLTELYALGGVVAAFFNEADGAVVIERAESCASSLVAYSKENPQVRRVLERLVTTSALGGVLVAHFGLGYAIARNHNPNLPALATGDLSPDGLDASPVADFPPGMMKIAADLANDPERMAKLADAFGMDLDPALANGATGGE